MHGGCRWEVNGGGVVVTEQQKQMLWNKNVDGDDMISFGWWKWVIIKKKYHRYL